MLAVIKHVLGDNFFFQHGAYNTVQPLQRKTLNNCFSWAAVPNSFKLNSVDYKIEGVIQECEYALQVNKTKEIKQRLVELSQSSNTAFWMKRHNFCVSVFCQVAQKH